MDLDTPPPPESSEPVAEEPPVVDTAPVSADGPSVDEPTATHPVRAWTLHSRFRHRCGFET
jgi:hypothetical protein